MRKALLVIVILAFLALLVIYYPQHVEKPVKDGEGSLAVRMDPGFAAPATHNPLYWWQANHPDVVNRGDLVQADCLYCHEPQTSCNNCHNYVGANEIVAP